MSIASPFVSIPSFRCVSCADCQLIHVCPMSIASSSMCVSKLPLNDLSVDRQLIYVCLCPPLNCQQLSEVTSLIVHIAHHSYRLLQTLICKIVSLLCLISIDTGLQERANHNLSTFTAAKSVGSTLPLTSQKERWELLHIAWIVQSQSADIPAGDPKVLVK